VSVAKLMEMVGGHLEIVHYLRKIAFREFAVEFVHQRDAFFTGKMLVPDFLRSVVSGAANAELYEGRVVVQVVDLVVDAVVLAVSALGPEGPGLEPAVLRGVVISLLRCPFEVVAEVVHLDVRLGKLLRVSREKGLDVREVQPVVLEKLGDADPCQIHVLDVVMGKIRLVTQRDRCLGNGVAILCFGFAIKNQRNAELGRNAGGKVLLAEDEGLKRMQQILY
jgi:hypothetical protein